MTFSIRPFDADFYQQIKSREDDTSFLVEYQRGGKLRAM